MCLLVSRKEASILAQKRVKICWQSRDEIHLNVLFFLSFVCLIQFFHFKCDVCKVVFKMSSSVLCLNLNKINICMSSVDAMHSSRHRRKESQRI